MKLPWNKARTDLDREVAYHIETMADAFEAEGMSRADALARARKEFGGVEQVKEQCRDESRWGWAVELAQDLRFGWRMMRKSPAASIAAVASLALGIGATTAIFSFADAVLWRKLAVPAPEQMLEVYWESQDDPEGLLRGSSGSSSRNGGVTVADFFSKSAFESFRERTAGKLQVAAHISPREVSVSGAGDVVVTSLRGVSDNFFDTLGIQPFAGRLLANSAGRDAVVSYRFAERHLGGPGTIGKAIRVNGHSYTVVGVLPKEFFGLVPGDAAEIYTTIFESPELLKADSWYRKHAEDPTRWWHQVVARRAPGVSLEEARAALDTIFPATWAAQPKNAPQTPRIRLADASAGLGGVRGELGNPSLILLALVSLVLVIACANIANLLLARAAERQREIALRVSLGCSSGRLMRQFFTESLLLALLGGALSVAVALGLGSLMEYVMPKSPNAMSLMVELSWRTLAVSAAIALVAALLFGLYPAWRASRIDAAPALKDSGPGATRNSRLLPARVLIVAQVALGVLLVTAAIVYTGNLSHIVGRDAGFERSNLLLFDIRPGELGYSAERLAAFYRNAEARLREIPGVEHAALSRVRPMRGGGFHETLSVPGGAQRISSGVHFATPDFLDALGVPLLAGRRFHARETNLDHAVAIVSERLARELNVSLGGRIQALNNEWEIVGIARDASYSRLNKPMPVFYLPFDPEAESVTAVVRTALNPLALTSAARDAIRSVDRNVPLVDIFTMEQQISRVLQRERMFAWLCGSFGVLALVLCVVGIYGLMSHSTARRRPEIGIRLVLGATPRHVLRRVVGEGMRLAATGLLLGVPLALGCAKLAQNQRLLPEGPLPYWTLAAAVGALLLAAFLAVFTPAFRASSVDPIRVLKQG